MYSAILGLCFSDCDCKLVYFLLVDSSFDFSQVQNTAASKIAKKKSWRQRFGLNYSKTLFFFSLDKSNTNNFEWEKEPQLGNAFRLSDW